MNDTVEREDTGRDRAVEPGEIARRMVRCPDWLNLRAACIVAAAAEKIGSAVVVTKGGVMADARSVIDLMALGVEPGETLEILAEGEDAAEAVRALAALVTGNFEVRAGTPLAASMATLSPGLPGKLNAGSR
ncbi:MAG: HPr family phosphocarrier protein [Candidatus Coatesbacteria bacterium]